MARTYMWPFRLSPALVLIPLVFGFQSSESPDTVKPDKYPIVISKPEPKYTPEAENERIQGIVVLRLVVDEQGRATQIEVLSPLGYGLDESAMDAVAHWRFRPATKNGKPVHVTAQVEVMFRLQNIVYDEKTEKRRTAFNVALRAVEDGKVANGTVKSLSDLASQSYPPGLYLYGKVLETGLGVTANPQEGFRLIQESAGRKYGPAMYEVAMAWLKGDRLDKDPAKGMDLMRNAAKLGSRGAQTFLGDAYEKGDDVPPDPAKSRVYFRLCAASGDALCQFHLGKSLLEHSDHPDRVYVEAIAWLMLASDQKIEDAEKILRQEDQRLTPAQVASADRLKAQLVHHQ